MPEEPSPLLLKVIRDDPDAYNVKLATQVVHHTGN